MSTSPASKPLFQSESASETFLPSILVFSYSWDEQGLFDKWGKGAFLGHYNSDCFSSVQKKHPRKC